MSSSEHDNMSESSNLDPASNESTFSPYSGTSPSQIVPELANGIIELTCEDAIRENKPYLRIIEEPVDYFRFRYRSEMLGTHGCLLGRNSAQVKKSKSHPTVELCNYNGSALIRCSLARHNSSLEHPHKLTEEDQDRDITSLLPLRGSYKVAFSGLGIIHTAKKDIPTLLYKRYSQELKQNEFNERKLRMQCENETKNINLNIVRLMFTAHDVTTGAPICPPVFSQSINNLKSAATNDLKICRANRYYGRPNGGDTVYILVEKVNKKNIAIRFYELDEIGDKVWEDRGHFLQSDVHHQYAIVFTTPPYRDTKTKTDVKVFFELLRPSDGRCSEPKEFTYIADVYNRDVKKRKAESYSSLGSSGGSVKSFSDLPLTLDFANTLTKKEMDIDPMPILPPNNYIPPTPPLKLRLDGRRVVTERV
ncbi:unnamed protein product [Leptosia nina]|uniref:RHD domain-containing protein n=1 Tax=Leptosia nina TaxID=320188 RepID=A0AAV1J8V4_9NEOP